MDWSTSYSSGNEWENVTHWSEVPTPIQKATKKTLLSIHTHTNASLSSRALFFLPIFRSVPDSIFWY